MNYPGLINAEYKEAVLGMLPEWFDLNDDQWYQHVNRLPMKSQITYLVVILHNQVRNGGFHQYFTNGYGQFSKLTINALVEIECYRRAKLLSEALMIVNSDNDSDDVFRMKILKKEIDSLIKSDDLNDPLDLLDDSYYGMDEQGEEDIEQFLGSYLASR